MTGVPERVKQALEHVCPRCKSPTGVGCTRPSGSFLPSHTVHRAREEAASRVRDDAGPPGEIKTNQGRACWRSWLDTLRERGQVTPGNRRLLLSAVRNLEEAETAHEAAAASPEVVGSTGQQVANPQFAVAARCQERCLAALRALMLTPDTRVAAPAGGHLGGEVGDELDELDVKRRSKSGR